MENKKKYKYIFVRDENGEMKKIKVSILSRKNKSKYNICRVNK